MRLEHPGVDRDPAEAIAAIGAAGQGPDLKALGGELGGGLRLLEDVEVAEQAAGRENNRGEEDEEACCCCHGLRFQAGI